MDSEHAGSQVGAAEALDVGRGTLQRWLSGRDASMQLRLLAHVGRRLSLPLAIDMAQAVLGDAVPKGVKRYNEWLQSRIVRAEAGRQPSGGAHDIAGPVDGLRRLGAAGLAEPLPADCRLASLLRLVKADHSERCSNFEQHLRDRGHSRRRILLAYVRALEPFVESYDSGFVERRWIELEFREQQDYLEVSFKRELMLADRDNDATRTRKRSEEVRQGLKVVGRVRLRGR